MKKTLLIGTLILSFFLFQSPLYALNQIPELLCELGVKLYRSGRYAEALHEFKKALIANPNYIPAKKYIKMMEQANLAEPEIVPSTFKPISPEPKGAMNELLDLIDLQREMIRDKELIQVETVKKKEKPEIPAKKKIKKLKTPVAITKPAKAEVKQPQPIVQPNKPIVVRPKPVVKQDVQPAKQGIQPTEIVVKPSGTAIEPTKLAEQPAKTAAVQSLEEVIQPPETVSLPTTTAGSLSLREAKESEAILLSEPSVPLVTEKKKVREFKPAEQNVITLDNSLSSIPSPIEIEMGKSFIIKGNNISRYLITQPKLAKVQKNGPNELIVTGEEVGYTQLFVWDDSGRWSMDFLGILPKPEGPTYEETIRKEQERSRNFRLRYNLDWVTYEAGKGVSDLKRSSYYWTHSLSLNGPTPYGDLDSAFTIRRLNINTDLTYLTFGLTNGVFGNFKGFSLRGMDYNPNFTNLAFQGTTLRGVMFSSPAFNNKFNYTTFWGREGGGRYGNLSPTLSKTENSFIAGTNLQYTPTDKQNYKFTVVHGWGRDREPLLNKYDYDLMGDWKLNKLWGMGYEIANDSERFAHLFNIRYRKPKLSFTTELRNIDKAFNSITSRGWRQGELGALLNLNYQPTEKLRITSSLDAYQDRLYPALDNPQRWNQDFNYNMSYQVDNLTGVNLSYLLNNDQGRLSEIRFQSPGIGINRDFNLFKKRLSTYFNYYHQENTNFTAHSVDYVNDKYLAGLRLGIFGGLYYYANKEYNMVIEESTSTHANPNAFETGLDWSDQIGKTPFFGNLRFTYRDEEETDTRISFLSGQDYIEGYSRLSYKPNADTEVYGSARFRNLWADNPLVTKGVNMDFNAGIRYSWDTGVHWDAVGNIEGYVFKDFNSDGLRQRDEPPVEGIKIWLGKNKFQVTDLFGYYKFKGVRARKAFVSLDATTLPRGYIVTVPLVQEVPIINHRTQKADFGVISETEISGCIFEDIDGNGEYTKEDKGVAGIVVTLEDGSKSITDVRGKYSFRNATPGEHAINVDINTIPVYYLPQKALKKQITLFEGVNYVFDLPLKRIEE
ncbi:MAG: pilus assembly protein N-terminal domain-containing protein [Candidatus Omnitrophica bacterium]|nr:pilus assembly protein N-terminal domain-containing protein [Candidatus Omnitrophota bacterium]